MTITVRIDPRHLSAMQKDAPGEIAYIPQVCFEPWLYGESYSFCHKCGWRESHCTCRKKAQAGCANTRPEMEEKKASEAELR